MNWKKEAIEKLKEYNARKQAITSIPLEIAQLESAVRGIRSASADGVAISGGGSGREDMLLSNICKREELKRSLATAKVWVAQVEDAMSVLNQEERLVLDRFYINPARGNVDRLCGELNVEKSQVYARKDAALRHFTISLYGCAET